MLLHGSIIYIEDSKYVQVKLTTKKDIQGPVCLHVIKLLGIRSTMILSKRLKFSFNNHM